MMLVANRSLRSTPQPRKPVLSPAGPTSGLVTKKLEQVGACFMIMYFFVLALFG